MADQHFSDGDIIPTHNYGNFEVIGVQYQEDGDGNKTNMTYLIRHQETLNAERAEAARVEEEAKLAANAAQASEDDDRAAQSAQEAAAEHAALNERRTDQDPQAPGVGETVNNDRVRIPSADSVAPEQATE